MAIRLNYTGRRKINREDIDLRLRPGSETTFDAALKLERYKISEADARVWVEAYHRTILMRFDFGRVGLIVPQTDRRLSLFPDPDAVLFRVKVTSESGENRGRLLAEADGIKGRRPDEKDDDRIPLLPVRQGILGAELWRVEYTGEGESPELVINTAVDDWKILARDPKFHPVVAPAALHLILTRLALVERARYKEDDSHWHNKWWRFVVSLPGADRDFAIEDGTDPNDILGWIDDAVAAFAKESNTLETFLRERRAGKGGATMTVPLRRLRASGIALFNQYLTELKAGGTAAPPDWLLADPAHTEAIEPTTPVPDAMFADRLAAALYLDELFTKAELTDIDVDTGLWAWLSLRFFDQVCPADKSGQRNPGEFSDGVYVRLVPAVQRDRKYYRHLLLGPYLILRTYRDDPKVASALLIDPPNVATAEAYRLFVENPSLISCRAAVGTATALYYDFDRNKMKRGFGRKTAGGCRRLVQVLSQFDLTFDLYSLTIEQLLGMLPQEFHPFKPRQMRLAI